MARVFKQVIIALGMFMGVIVLVVILSYINHKVRLVNEEAFFVPNGQRVQVNGHNLHLYFTGQGKETLVFMAGGGTSSPVLDFKSLYSLLSGKYKVVVIEKAGYGFSDVVDGKRNLATILSETREALMIMGMQGPYVLVPHSMSGLEALYWAQKYPHEVKAIVGLDMSVPESYNDYKANKFILTLGSLAANVGITRWIPGLSQSDAIKFGTLTEEEKELYKVIFYRRTATKTMIAEAKEVKNNANIVQKGSLPTVPILIFSSNGKGTGWEEELWKSSQRAYFAEHEGCQIIDLPCSHYVHDLEYEKIARDMEIFLDRLN